MVERSTRRFVAWSVTPTRSKELFESLVDAAPVAKNYFSDGFGTWAASWYPGHYEAVEDKSQTFSVEGGNSDLRHYVARLARSSRCFSRCPLALARAVDLFVRAWNARQTFKRTYPKLKPPLRNFIP